MIKRILFAASLFVAASLNAQPKLFIIGDSTSEIWKGSGWYPCMGWGAVFQHFLDKDKVIVDNRAVGGTTTKSFYNQHWSKVIPDINAGDYLFISFGANDSNSYATYCTTTEEFIDYIGIFCSEARAKGATPVLLSTVNQNIWSKEGTLKQTYGEHPKAMQEASKKYDTPFFDLYSFGFSLSEAVGEEYNTYYRHNNYKAGEYDNYPEGKEDNVHLQETGATDFARYIVEEIEKSDDERLKVLADATTPRYNVTFDSDNDSLVSSISRSATFPEGINVTLKSYSVDSTRKCFWINDNGDLISKDHLFVYVMRDHDEHFTAIYNDSSILQTCRDEFRIYSDRVVFTDNDFHTVCIYGFDGKMLSSASAKYSYVFNLRSGFYILTIDEQTSTKIRIK